MKNIFLLPYFTYFIFISASAQTNVYHPFPDSNASWNYAQNEPCHIDLIYHTYSFVLDGDTAIGSNTYHKLSIPFVNSWSTETGCPPFFRGLGYQGGIRQDTAARKVFFILPFDSVEVLLFDFSLQVGDSVHGIIDPWNCAVVSAIDSVECSDGWRNKWVYATDGGPREVAEGMGDLHRGLLDILCVTLDSHGSNLFCFAQTGQSIYPNTTWQCLTIDAVEEPTDQNTQSELVVSPNPAENILTIGNRLYAINSIEICNALGERLYSEVTNCESCPPSPSGYGGQSIVNCESCPPGIYFVKATSGDKIFFEKIIKH